MVLSFSAQLIKVTSATKLVQGVIRLLKLLLKVGEVLHDGCTVTNVALTHAFLLSCILLSFGILNGVLSLDSDILAKALQLSIASVFVDANFDSR